MGQRPPGSLAPVPLGVLSEVIFRFSWAGSPRLPALRVSAGRRLLSGMWALSQP